MQIAGIGLHIIIAIIFAIHALRTGKELYWLFILFMFPLFGSIVYFVAVYLPDSKLQYSAKRAMSAAAKTLDPSRELREARAAYDYTPTVQNQMRLALALLEAGSASEAAEIYEACLKGPYADDPEIRFCAARAFVESGRHVDALGYLEGLRNENAHFRVEQIGLLMALAHAGLGHNEEAKVEFESTFSRFGSFSVLAEYTVWAINIGDNATAQRLQAEIDQRMKNWNKHSRELNKQHVQRVNAARNAVKSRA